MYRNTTWGKC